MMESVEFSRRPVLATTHESRTFVEIIGLLLTQPLRSCGE